MEEEFDKQAVSTPPDEEKEAVDPKPSSAPVSRRLALLIAAIVVVGSLLIAAGYFYFASQDTFEATIVAVTKATVTFKFDMDADDVDFATYPKGMTLRPGDKVLIRIDLERGNLVEKVLEE